MMADEINWLEHWMWLNTEEKKNAVSNKVSVRLTFSEWLLLLMAVGREGLYTLHNKWPRSIYGNSRSWTTRSHTRNKKKKQHDWLDEQI